MQKGGCLGPILAGVGAGVGFGCLAPVLGCAVAGIVAVWLFASVVSAVFGGGSTSSTEPPTRGVQVAAPASPQPQVTESSTMAPAAVEPKRQRPLRQKTNPHQLAEELKKEVTPVEADGVAR